MNYLEFAKQIIENRWTVGVRGLCEDEQYEVGDDCRPSYEWDFDLDVSTYKTTGETAGGTCVIGLDGFIEPSRVNYPEVEDIAGALKKAVEMANKYGVKTAIIASDERYIKHEWFDDHEIRLRHAFVIALVD